MECKRISSLLASGTEILYGLGLGDRVVAVSHECDYPAEITEKPRVTYTKVPIEASSKAIDTEVRQLVANRSPIYEIDVDRLASLAPDLIVTQAQCDVCAVSFDDVSAAVRNVGALEGTRVVALNATTLKGIFDDIRRVGKAAGCGERAEAYIASLSARVDAIQTKTTQLPPEDRPRVVCIEWIDPIMIAANWMPELIEIAGGQSALTTAGKESTYTNWSDVVTYDPEVIVVMPCGFDLDRTVQESHTLGSLPGWRDLAATKRNRVYAVDGSAYFNRSGPRIVDSLEILAQLIHPRLFGDAWARQGNIWRVLPSPSKA